MDACSGMGVVQVFVRARQKLGEILSAFEFLDQQSLELTLTHLEGIRNPLPDTQTPFYLVVETSGSNEAHDYAKIEVSQAPLPCINGLLEHLFLVKAVLVSLSCKLLIPKRNTGEFLDIQTVRCCLHLVLYW